MRGFWRWLALDRTITEAAAQIYATLPETIFLRSADCIHLVTARHHDFAEIYSHDQHQRNASPSLGPKTITIQP